MKKKSTSIRSVGKLWKKVVNYTTPNDPYISIVDVDLDNELPVVKCGLDNLLPQQLSELNRISPIHRGVLNSKTRYQAGTAIGCDDSKMRLFVENINDKQSLHDFHKRILFDFNSFGNAYFLIILDSNKNFVGLKYRDSITARITKDRRFIVFNPDWENFWQLKDRSEIFPAYPAFKRDGKFFYSCVQIKEEENGFPFYGIPSWFSGLKNASLSHKLDKWNLSRVDNNMNVSGILTVEDNVDSVEEADDLRDSIIKEFSGEGQTGGIVVIVKEPGGDVKTQYTPIDTDTDGDWIKLKDSNTTDLIIAHEWKRSLASIPDNTGFDTTRILNEYEDALNNSILPSQSFWKKIYTRIFALYGLNFETAYFVNNSPVESKRAALSEGQVRLIIELKGMIKDGTFTPEAAVQLLVSSYNFTKRESEDILWQQ
jgi:hypothetical protein